MKIRYCMIVVLMLVLSALPVSTAIQEQGLTNSGQEIRPATTLYEDELDQNQSVFTEGAIVPIGRLIIGEAIIMVQVAQSFIPTKDLLTRVEILATKNVTASYPLVVGIRDNLTHENLVETSVPPSSFISGNYTWVVCDFDDLWVTPGKTYYLVTQTKNATDNIYGWAANNNSEAYPNGCAWFSIDNGSSWNQSATQHQLPHDTTDAQRPRPCGAGDASGDMCFRTYGLQEATLAITTGGTFLTPELLVTNVGNITTWDVHWHWTITGGILNLINSTDDGSQTMLASDESISLPVSAFGFGPLLVTAEVQAVNSQKVSFTQDALVIFIFIFWK